MGFTREAEIRTKASAALEAVTVKHADALRLAAEQAQQASVQGGVSEVVMQREASALEKSLSVTEVPPTSP